MSLVKWMLSFWPPLNSENPASGLPWYSTKGSPFLSITLDALAGLFSQSPNHALNSLVRTWAYCSGVKFDGLPLGASSSRLLYCGLSVGCACSSFLGFKASMTSVCFLRISSNSDSLPQGFNWLSSLGIALMLFSRSDLNCCNLSGISLIRLINLVMIPPAGSLCLTSIAILSPR